MKTYFASGIMERLRGRFERLYGNRADRCLSRLAMMIGRYGLGEEPVPPGPRWTEKDAWLITYADAIRAAGEKPLATLKRFLDRRLAGAINTAHLLPFFPSSSDDGFSVVHYRTVRPELGSWADIRALGESFGLMMDLVLNHVSRRSGWFLDYQAAVAPGRHYFIEADPAADWTAVMRPRSTPLLHPVETRGGTRHVWTTFSEDQVDLDYSNPDVLFELLDILLFYVSMGARVIRLDAIAYLWKKPGTPCIHLPETHEIVKLMRDFLALAAPRVLLLTETNVPHGENVAYFGNGDEAHLVYQFSLPPLILHALLRGDASALTRWAGELAAPPPGCTFLNFTASHDGIGVRPLQGLVPDGEIRWLENEVRARGGQVSHKRNADGSESPYELNCAWFSALSDPDPERHAARFLCSQAMMLALRGVPALYLNNLLAAPNDAEAVSRTGRARSINRRAWTEAEVQARLDDPGSPAARVFRALTDLLKSRAAQSAFHPDGEQRILDLGPAVFAVERTAPGGGGRVLALHNCSERTVEVRLPGDTGWKGMVGDPWAGPRPALRPYAFAWLVPA
ncbi:MAG: sugar phosphorylase [Kiritimatiellae bacterium]|nr:sugar phosphorylase [Kiritimatiellia bacterium]